MKDYKKFVLLLAIVFSHCPLWAQSIEPSTINVQGDYFANGSFELDWNLGEMALVSTVENPNLIVTQGLLQPDANIPDNINENYFNQQGVSVYPNPTLSELNIQANLEESGEFTIRITDVQGKIILTEKMLAIKGANNIQLSLNAVAQGNYMLMLQYQSNQSHTSGKQNFKIQKLN